MLLSSSIILMFFSRKREFIANTGGADLVGYQNMISVKSVSPVKTAINTIEKINFSDVGKNNGIIRLMLPGCWYAILCLSKHQMLENID